VALTCLAWFKPLLGEGIFAKLENLGVRLAERKRQAILVLMLLVPVVRLPLLAIMPAPVPVVHDEFSYLLVADTFVHGRLTNPPHLMREYFETIHVNQLPTYMSKYPPAQGAVLAMGQILGHPWIGVVISVSMMCGSILWMLQGWMPARWALLGAILAFLRLGIFSYWINSYWGGAVPVIGGALVIGALPRILKHQNARDALLLGIGVAILANSRPFEGLILCLPVAGFLMIWLFSRTSPSCRITLPRVCVPIFAVLLLTGVFLCFYNWKGTGNPLLFPYQVNERTYMSTPPFFWQKLKPPLSYANPVLDATYNQWARSFWSANRFAFLKRAAKLAYFFLWPELCILAVTLPAVIRDRRTRLLLIQFFVSFVGLLVVVWCQPHYAAPIICVIYALLLQAMRHLRRWTSNNRQVGIGLTRAIVVFSGVMCLTWAGVAARDPRAGTLVASAGVWGVPGNWARAEILSRLESIPGEHLVIVRSSDQLRYGEWVSNGADLEYGKVIWAHEIPGKSLEPLIKYYSSRHVWRVEWDHSSPQLVPFTRP
jgi:hypothetical protein